MRRECTGSFAGHMGGIFVTHDHDRISRHVSGLLRSPTACTMPRHHVLLAHLHVQESFVWSLDFAGMGGLRVSNSELGRAACILEPAIGTRVRVIGSECGEVRSADKNVYKVKFDSGRVVRVPLWALNSREVDVEPLVQEEVPSEVPVKRQRLVLPRERGFRRQVLHCCRVLGVEVGATEEVIRSVWKKQVLHAHPDKGGSPSRFREIQEAYELVRSLVA